MLKFSSLKSRGHRFAYVPARRRRIAVKRMRRAALAADLHDQLDTQAKKLESCINNMSKLLMLASTASEMNSSLSPIQENVQGAMGSTLSAKTMLDTAMMLMKKLSEKKKVDLSRPEPPSEHLS